MVTAGVKGILITVADAKAENAAIAKARKAGVLVIALDSPTEPDDGRRRALRDEQLQRRRPDREVRPGRDEGQDRDDRDARRARGLVGRSASAQRLPQGLRDQDRRQADRLRRRTAAADTADSQTAMENCLQKNPNIDVVYTINEPSAAGAWTALKNAGKSPERHDDRVRRRRLRRRAERQGRRDRRDLAAVPAADGVARRLVGRQVREDGLEGVRATRTRAST